MSDVVKSLNTMLFSVMTAPRGLGMPPTAFVSGNDADAKSVVKVALTVAV
jgi:predicted dinucleotide-binding enzyme